MCEPCAVESFGACPYLVLVHGLYTYLSVIALLLALITATAIGG
ncbi:hypothetical protein [Streptomyces niveus]|nr:hypothetical protein [Streptomyces niveus]